MRLSQFEGDEALEVLCDLIDPFAELGKDKKVVDLLSQSKPKELVKYLIKEHKKEVYELVAATERCKVEDVKMKVLTVPIMLFNLVTDPDLMKVFTSQELQEAATSFSPVFANTEE